MKTNELKKLFIFKRVSIINVLYELVNIYQTQLSRFLFLFFIFSIYNFSVYFIDFKNIIININWFYILLYYIILLPIMFFLYNIFILMAYSEDKPIISKGIFINAKMKFLPQVVTTLSLFVYLLPIILIITGIIVAAIYISPETFSSNNSIYITVYIIFSFVIILCIRYLYGSVFTVLTEYKGLNSLKLSVLLFKSNRFISYLIWLLFYGCIFILNIQNDFTLSIIYTLIKSIVSAFLSVSIIYYQVILFQLSVKKSDIEINNEAIVK